MNEGQVTMIKHFCDICGREITDVPSNPSSIILTIDTKGFKTETKYLEICWKCAREKTVLELREVKQ